MLAALGLASLLLAAPSDRLVTQSPVRGGSDDQVDIIQPEDESYFPDVPSTVTVVVDVSNDSALEVQEVHLEVDAKEQDTFCEQAGMCEWTLELDEGEHVLRSVVVRNIGGPLLSQFVEIQVGGEPPADDGINLDSGGDDTTGGDDGAAASSSGAPDTDGSTGATDDTDEGCGCRIHDSGRFPRSWLVFAFAALLRRRRR